MWTLILGSLISSGCRKPQTEPKPSPVGPDPVVLRDEIPAEHMNHVLDAHFQGLGAIEQYRYAEAVAAFQKVHQLAPGWIDGSINLAIALLNDTGLKIEEEKEQGGGAVASPGNFEEALRLLNAVIDRAPNHLRARYCRGIIYEYLADERAYEDFRFVVDRDPTDGHAWFYLGSSMELVGDSIGVPSPEDLEQRIEVYSKALERNPYLMQALYKLSRAYILSGRRDEYDEVYELWNRINPQQNVVGVGENATNVYGEMGRYAQVRNPGQGPQRLDPAPRPPRFSTPEPTAIELPDGHRWAKASDFVGDLALKGRARDRFGAAISTFDADGDGRIDLYLCSAVVGPEGVRDVLLRNMGDGRFEDVSESFGLPGDRASLGVAAGDFDADLRVDLYLTGVGDNRLLRNLGDRFEDVTEEAGVANEDAVSLTARWLDLDQDGDLDLYVVNYTNLEHAELAFTEDVPPGIQNAAFRNDGQARPIQGVSDRKQWVPIATAPRSGESKVEEGLSIAFSEWPDAEALLGGKAPHTAIAALDIDNDRDIDLVLAADGEPLNLIVNNRLGRFHSQVIKGVEPEGTILGMLILDLDRDGLSDLVILGPEGGTAAYRNLSRRGPDGTVEVSLESWPMNPTGWRSAISADLDLDGRFDLVGLPGPDSIGPEWARNEPGRLALSPLALGPDEAIDQPLRGVAVADLFGDGLPDLLVLRDGHAPRIAQNLGNGHHWIAIDLSGRWNWSTFDYMRTNPHGLGTKLSLEGRGLSVPFEYTTLEAGLAQSITPLVFGLGTNTEAPTIRLQWPDGVMQCELNKGANQLLEVTQNNRKVGSCPVLFTWNGERFDCIGDFLGGGGLGYLVAPGVYSQPDRDEAVQIRADQLRPVDGVYRLSITEPMDEITYLDKVTLDVVDRPPGVEAHPNERFAPGGNRPTGELIAWRETIEPVLATDLEGHDVTEALRHWDRVTVDGFRRLRHWIGYAEEHGIVLDFGDRLRAFDEETPLILCLAGWVEYPYSQTNYAATTAGIALQPPVLERLLDHGDWETIELDPGYPAGLPRMTTLNLTGKLTDGERCVIRLRTNMECYWDQAFLALQEPDQELRVTELAVGRAVLGNRGYTREVSPDGQLPLLYDYAYVDPAPLARFEGRLTQYGDVAELLIADDDRFCLIGPGDEVRLEFDAESVPGLPEGWTRSFVLRAIGYCKDADPFTATSDTVGPLPWKEMPDFPFGPEAERPRDEEYQAYLRTYQTRKIGEP
ncbi:hypothetical protein BH23PLA1_BH23PLA1_27520 [soil metagenome]